MVRTALTVLAIGLLAALVGPAADAAPDTAQASLLLLGIAALRRLGWRRHDGA